MTNYEFRVHDWARFQHYKKRDQTGKPTRAPAWIKVYVKLLDDPAYLSLTGIQRGLLHDIWLWWARMDLGERWTGLNIQLFNRLLANTARIPTWKALQTAGFIEIRASTGLGDNTTDARAEVEEEEKELQQPSTTDLEVTQQAPSPTGNVVELDEHRGRGAVNGRPLGAAIEETLAALQAAREANG